MSDDKKPDLFVALDNFSQGVALLSGVRSKFIEQGWSQQGAEMATVALLQASHSGYEG